MTELTINSDKPLFRDYGLLLVSIIWIVALISAGAVAIYQQGFDWQFSPFIGAAIAPAVLGVLLHPVINREWAQILVIFAWIALAIAATLAIAFVPMAFLFLCAPAAAALFEREKVIEAMVLSALAAGFVYYANRFGFNSTYQLPNAFEDWGRTTAPVATIVFMIGAMYAAASKGQAVRNMEVMGGDIGVRPDMALKAFPGGALLVDRNNKVLELSDTLSDQLGRDLAAHSLHDDQASQMDLNLQQVLISYGVSDTIITEALAGLRKQGQAQSFQTGQHVMGGVDAQDSDAQDSDTQKGGRDKRVKVDLVPADNGRAYIYMTPVSNLSDAQSSKRASLAGVQRALSADNDVTTNVQNERDMQDNPSLYFAGISHELRTPLNAIIGFSDMMRARLFGPLPGKYAEYADLIHESGQYMLDLVGDVLDQSKINAGQYELSYEDFDMVDLARSCVKMMSSTADDASVSLRIDCADDLPVMLRADRRAVRQIMLNLLSNAVKFSPAGSETVIALLSDLEEGEVQIDVRDQGQGMSVQELESLGRPYAQGEAGKMSEQRGSGLGLSLVKSLTELHKGRFEAESEMGNGTTVRITLPDAPAG